MSKYEIKFEKCSEAWHLVEKMKDIIKEYGQVRVADQKELCGHNHTYTDNNYGWKELRNHFITYDAASKKYTLHLSQPEPLEKGCTYDRCTENRYGYRCPHCQSLNLREVSSYHNAGDSYQTIGYCCSDCHTTFTVDNYDVPECDRDQFYAGGVIVDLVKTENEQLRKELEEVKKELEEYVEKCRVHTEQIMRYKGQAELWLAYSQSLDHLNDKMSRELDDIKLVVEAVKKDNKNLKTELEYLCKELGSKLSKEKYIRFKDLSLLTQALIRARNYGSEED